MSSTNGSLTDRSHTWMYRQQYNSTVTRGMVKRELGVVSHLPAGGSESVDEMWEVERSTSLPVTQCHRVNSCCLYGTDMVQQVSLSTISESHWVSDACWVISMVRKDLNR